MKFSIVTPTFNSQRFLSRAIESVIGQKGDFSIEYIIVDNCSTDQTGEIVDRYRKDLETDAFPGRCHDIRLHFIREPDSGMYDAIAKGFAVATGDILAWINSDDIYLAGAFEQVRKVFSGYPEVEWLKGITTYIDENGDITSYGRFLLYDRNRIKKGFYGPVLYFIQQAGVFWRSNLWERGKGGVSGYTLAGDYYLWRQFANFAPLYAVNTFLSCFRIVNGQKSEDMQAYWDEMERQKDFDGRLRKLLRLYLRMESRLPGFLGAAFHRLIFGPAEYPFILIGPDGNQLKCISRDRDR